MASATPYSFMRVKNKGKYVNGCRKRWTDEFKVDLGNGAMRAIQYETDPSSIIQMDYSPLDGIANTHGPCSEIPITPDILPCMCEITKGKKTRARELYENGEVILAMKSNTDEGMVLNAAILNKKTNKISLLSSVNISHYEYNPRPTYNPDFMVCKAPLQAPIFFWRRLKNILQDTYGKE